MSTLAVTGDKALDRQLAALGEKVGRKILRTAVTKSARVLVKAIKAEVPSRLKGVRASIGAKTKTRQGIVEAKVGTVAKQTGKDAKRSKGAKGGVGISAANVHWWILGTDERKRKKIRGAIAARASEAAYQAASLSTGKMPAHPIVKPAVTKAGKDALRVMHAEIRKGIAAEVARR